MRKLILYLSLCCGALSVGATDYLVTTNSYEFGWWIQYQQREFLAGVTTYQTIGEALAVAKPGDNIFLAPGTYAESFTIGVDNVSIIGHNAWRDNRSGTRDASQESIITGCITLNANSVTLNGLKIMGGGRVLNTTATNAAPISDFVFKYNLVEASTLEASTPIVYLGKVYGDDANANSDVSQLRYNNITISHNDFNGTSSTNNPHFIKIGGGYGNLTVHDNYFTQGGNSIEIGNSRGSITVTNNKFKDVGQALYDVTATEKKRGGAFCVYLHRNSYAGTTNINVSHNEFDNCTGRQTIYALVRYYQGDSSSEYVVPVGTTAKFNYNVFLNKTTYSYTNDYNYVLFCNDGYMGDVEVDARYNYFDNSDMCLGLIKMPGKTQQERFFSSSFGFYDFRKSQNVTYEQVLKGWENPRSCRVAQSFDVSEYDFDDNGTPYYYFNHIQELSAASNISTYGCPEAQLITRVYNANTTNEKRAHIDAIHAGHGSNMVIFRYGGKNWVCCGGNGALNSTGESCLSNGISFFPYHSANLKADYPSMVDCSEGSTSFIDINQKTRPIYHFETDNERKSSSWYGHCPAIDETSRYLAVLSRKKGGPMCVEVYDFDEILEHVMNGAARPSTLQSFQIQKGADAYSGITGDQGFWTWDHQGFTISGDYIYFMEGCGVENENSINQEPTVIFHAYNWRTGKSHLRRRVEASPIMSMSHGEPEGIKIRRDATGRPYIYLNIANGPGGDRNVNLFKYSNYYTGGGFPYGISLPLTKGKTTSSTSTMTFATSDSETQSLTLNNTYLKGDLAITVTGENAEFFDVETDATNALSDVSNVRVTYRPNDPTSSSHNAVLRISSPYANDVLVTLNATYNGVITSVDEIMVDVDDITFDGTILYVPDGVVSTSVYDLMGNVIVVGQGNISLNQCSNGIYIVKCITPTGSIVKKIKI